jgi:hypothetical protein
MRFYYRYVNGLKEPESITPEIDHALFGQILHRIMKIIYSDSIDREISSGFIDTLVKDESHLMNIIDQAVNECYNSDFIRPPSGNDIIIRDILFIYVQKILSSDMGIAPFTILGLEKSFSFMLQFKYKGEDKNIRTGGNIDRIDRFTGKTRIVDYKTGETVQKIGSVYDLFDDDRKKDLDGWLQTLLYCEAYLAENPDIIVRPSIYKVKELSQEKFSDMLVIKDEKKDEYDLEEYQKIRGSFLEGLKGLITTIFSIEEPFRMTKTLYKCGYCPYSGLCQR